MLALKFIGGNEKSVFIFRLFNLLALEAYEWQRCGDSTPSSYDYLTAKLISSNRGEELFRLHEITCEELRSFSEH